MDRDELTLDELLAAAITRLLMHRDGVSESEIRILFERLSALEPRSGFDRAA